MFCLSWLHSFIVFLATAPISFLSFFPLFPFFLSFFLSVFLLSFSRSLSLSVTSSPAFAWAVRVAERSPTSRALRCDKLVNHFKSAPNAQVCGPLALIGSTPASGLQSSAGSQGGTRGTAWWHRKESELDTCPTLTGQVHLQTSDSASPDPAVARPRFMAWHKDSWAMAST